MRYAITPEREGPRYSSDDTLAVLPLFDDVLGCEKFVQRVLRFPLGSSPTRVERSGDELLYVLAGGAELILGGERVDVEEGTGIFLASGTSWSLECRSPLECLSVLVRDPDPPPRTHGRVDLAAAGRRSATASRQFILGVGPEVGCVSATQFLGFVPPGRAPDHYHRYDEVLYVLAGEGLVHIAGEQAPLTRGASVHLPAGVVHCLENTGASELQLLGVFRPAGSPAEAYYPDGTPAGSG